MLLNMIFTNAHLKKGNFSKSFTSNLSTPIAFLMSMHILCYYFLHLYSYLYLYLTFALKKNKPF